jgi:hypothetical protein
MKTNLASWIRSYATSAATLFCLAAIFIALTVGGTALPMALLCVGVGLFTFRYWGAIKGFDLWALDEWVRTRMESSGISEWHTPYHAAALFCDPTVARARNEASLIMNSTMMEMIKDPSRKGGGPADTVARHADYEAARARHDQMNIMLSRDLHRQLIAGTLMAKGLPTQNETMRSERIIPKSRWRIMNLDISKAEASGRGLHYIGIVIGKKPSR